MKPAWRMLTNSCRAAPPYKCAYRFIFLSLSAPLSFFLSLSLSLSLSLTLSSSVSFVVAFVCKDEKDLVNEGPCSLLRVSGGNSEKWPSPFWIRYLTQWLNRWFGSWKFGRSYGAMISLLGIRESIKICLSQRVHTVYWQVPSRIFSNHKYTNTFHII